MTHRLWWLTLCVVALTACAEKEQTLGTKKDAAAYAGTTNGYAAQGWQAGDKNSWEQQLRTRGQYGMNDHTRAPD
jgi:hypothetical protein